MPAFHAFDRTELAYHVRGDGDPLICLPGGPMRASACLGDLGGLSRQRTLILLDLRGTGDSAVPADPSSYRCDRLVDDVVALQDHLGLATADVLGHSAGANLAVQYALRHPHRVSGLVLVTPSGRAVGLEPDPEMRREIVNRRQGEPWFADAAGEDQTNADAAEAFGADGAFDPAATRASLAGLGSPVLVIGGSLDLQRPPAVTAEYAALFPAARLVVQPDAGHFPWLDDPGRFVSAVTEFLTDLDRNLVAERRRSA